MVDQQQPSRKVDPNFGESPQGEVRRIYLLGTSVNKGKRKDRSLKITLRPSQL
jgi:hypothetical protein